MSGKRKLSKLEELEEAVEKNITAVKNVKVAEMQKEGDYRRTIERFADERGRAVRQIPLNRLRPAPEEWNKFPPLPPDMRIEMKLSILANGLFNPIIVWEQEDDYYMILSGHNRTSIYQEILEEYENEDIEALLNNASDEETYALVDKFDIRNFSVIEAVVMGRNDIDEDKAREIILDTNYIQRGTDKKLLTMIIMDRLGIVKRRRDLKGKSMNVVAKEMNISASTVHRQWVLANKIVPAMRNLYYEDRLSLVAVLRVQNLSEDTQNWVAEEYGGKLTNKMLQKVSEKKNYSKGDLTNLLDSLLAAEETKKVTVTVQVEEEWAEEFREAAMLWIRKRRMKKRG